MQFSPNLKIVDLHVYGDWVIVIFNDSLKVFNFSRGFQRENVVAQYAIRPMIEGSTKQGQVAVHANENFTTLTLAMQDNERLGRVKIITITQNPFQPQDEIKETSVFPCDGREPITGLAFS